MTSHSKQEHPFMKHKATFYILVVLVSKYILLYAIVLGYNGLTITLNIIVATQTSPNVVTNSV